MSIFLKSCVFPYIEPVNNYRGAYWVKAEVNWNKEDGRFDHHGKRICFGLIHDDDYIDEEALLEAMHGKTIYDANEIFTNWESI